MVGGRSPLAAGERLFRFEFPERPGALMKFLSAMAPNWNISLFHYRNQGVDFSSALVGIQAPAMRRRWTPSWRNWATPIPRNRQPGLPAIPGLKGADRHGVAVRVARGEGALGARIAHARLLAGARGMRPPPALARVRRGDVDAFAHHRRGDLDAARRPAPPPAGTDHPRRASPDRACRCGSAAASGRADPGGPARFRSAACARRATADRRRRFPSGSGQRDRSAGRFRRSRRNSRCRR